MRLRASRVVVFNGYLTSSRSASVDLETDSKIQQTIQTQFKDKTLLCIARTCL